MKAAPDPERLVAKLRRLGETAEEIAVWTPVKTRDDARCSPVSVDVPSLLQILLARRTVTLANIDEYASPSGC